VLSREEVDRIIGLLEPPYDLAVQLLYGCGLRISECLGLRVGCFNLDARILTVHDGKGQKDRVTMLPATAVAQLTRHLEAVRRQHQADLKRGLGRVELPGALGRKYPNADREWAWQWAFPAANH